MPEQQNNTGRGNFRCTQNQGSVCFVPEIYEMGDTQNPTGETPEQ